MAGYNPEQPRNPIGDPRGGKWVSSKRLIQDIVDDDSDSGGKHLTVPKDAPDGWQKFAEALATIRDIDVEAPEADDYRADGSTQAAVEDVVEHNLVSPVEDPLRNALHPPDGSKKDDNAAIVAAGLIATGVDARTVAALASVDGFDDGTKTADLLLINGMELVEVKGITTPTVERA